MRKPLTLQDILGFADTEPRIDTVHIVSTGVIGWDVRRTIDSVFVDFSEAEARCLQVKRERGHAWISTRVLKRSTQA